MRAKTLTVSQDVLEVLSELKVDGDRVRIATQLDRPLYTKVNKILEAIGGEWTRKERAHVFKSGAQSKLDQVMVTGQVELGQDLGWFPTPGPLAHAIVEMADVRDGHRVLEPSAGLGALAFVALEVARCHVYAIERDVDRRRELNNAAFRYDNRLHVIDLDDFMMYRQRPPLGELVGKPVAVLPFDRVIMNPPFARYGDGDHLDHVRHAFRFLKPGGVLVSILPSSVEFRRDRRHVEFREWVNAHGSITSLPANSFKPRTGVNTCVIRIEMPCSSGLG